MKQQAEERCPCCGERQPHGLFAIHPAIEYPLVVELAQRNGETAETIEHDGLLVHNGRWFLQARLNLPVRRADSPLAMRIWIEINDAQIDAVRTVRDKQRRQVSGLAQIACELPGFVGSIGSPCRFRLRAGQHEATIVAVSDRRISDIAEDSSHDQLAELYRLVWGNPDPLVSPQESLRDAARAGWQQMIGRACYVNPVDPPPALAGSPEVELLVSPPLDTGEPAFLATIGAAEAVAAGSDLIEIGAWIRNPSADVIRCFSEFSYLTRSHSWESFAGRLLMEQDTIPDTDEALVAWFLTEPWWTDQAVATADDGRTIKLVVAIPLHAEEVNYAGVFGLEALHQELQMTSEDLTDLDRGPAATLAREL